jgi:hypothetical protein
MGADDEYGVRMRRAGAILRQMFARVAWEFGYGLPPRTRALVTMLTGHAPKALPPPRRPGR